MKNLKRHQVNVQHFGKFYRLKKLNIRVGLPAQYTNEFIEILSQMCNYFNGAEVIRTEESEANYRKEWKEIIDCLYSYPCIGVWVPFNEAWGQFRTEEVAQWTKEYDPGRFRKRLLATENCTMVSVK